MKIRKCKHNKNGFFDGPLILEPLIYKDSRGLFFESWNMSNFNEIISSKSKFVQDNQSISRKGVLRGMHYQLPPMDQGKLVRCSNGSVFDVIVDIRKRSNTFSFWAGINLNSLDNKQLWIPPGFAHGFLTLEENSIFEYKVTNYWSREHERSLIWNDATIGIDWPDFDKVYLSQKDSESKNLKKLEFLGDLF